MQHLNRPQYDNSLPPRPAGRRNVRRRRSYTLNQAITPKTCGLIPGSSKPEATDRYSVRTGRAIYIFCGLVFVGMGLYNILF